MPFQQQAQITQKLDTIAQSFGRLTERLERAYTLLGDGHTLMRNLLDAVPCGVLIFDEQHQLSYGNRAAEDLFGHLINEAENSEETTLENLKQAFSNCLLDPENSNQICNLFANVLEHKAAYLPDVVLQKQDQQIFLEVWINPDAQIFDQRYRIIKPHTIMILLDISERKRIEQVLRSEMRMQAEFKSADRILHALLPAKTPKLPNFEIAARCIPASAIGGDFYDWYFKDDQHLILSLGDVMGKEMAAALLMTTLRAALRTTVDASELDETITDVAETLISDFEQLGSFATVIHGRLQPQNRTLFYVSAGHTCGLMFRSNGKIEGLGDCNLPLGVPRLAPYRLHQFQFQPGDRLILYTRGIVHSQPNQELEEISQSFARLLEDCYHAEEILERLFQTTDDLGKYQDRTVLVLNCLG
ncbi:MAG: SpoIIE family protein phosphatase [Snowella sp.]|nr:SpoIIE family protein phosphatase [Snowella sp.]